MRVPTSRFRRAVTTIVAMTIGIGGLVVITGNESSAAEATWGPRDPWLRPFDANSIWNTPIGAGAQYVRADYPNYPQGSGDPAYLVKTTSADPLVTVRQPYEWRDRCNTAAPTTGQMRVPHSFYVADAQQRSDGSWKTPNNNGAILDPDGRTLRSIAMTCRDELGGSLYAWTVHTTDLYGDGIRGAHGATQMSAMGGAIRSGELTGDQPIAHALDLVMNAQYAYMDGTDRSTCYRWPASDCDGYAGNNGTYSGTNPEFKIGALLAIPPSVSCDAIGLETREGQKMCWTLKHYGGYFTDDSYWDANYIQVEADTPDAAAFGRAEVKRDLGRVIAATQIVANNSPSNIGGGGAPLAPRHVNEWSTGLWGTENGPQEESSPTTTTTTTVAPTTRVVPTTTTVPPTTTAPEPDATSGPDASSAPLGRAFADWFERTWVGQSWISPQWADWGLDGDRARVSGSSGHAHLVRDGASWVGTFEADVHLGTDAAAGLVGRWSDASHHVAVSARPTNTGVVLTAMAVVGGHAEVVGTATVANLGRLGLATSGRDVSVTVDGRVAIGARMSDAANRGVGLGTHYGLWVDRAADRGSSFAKAQYMATVPDFVVAGDGVAPPPTTAPPTTTASPTTTAPAASNATSGRDAPSSGIVSKLSPMVPVRVADTRAPGSPVQTLEAGQTVKVQVTGVNGVPAGASAVSANITAVGAVSAGYLTVFPCLGDPPNTSTVNFAGGVATPNSTIATLSPDGELCVFASERTELLIDVSGFFTTSAPLGFDPVAPVRVADTRSGLPLARVAAGEVVRVDVASALGVSEVTAVAANVTAVDASGPGYLTAWACDARPDTSIVNFVPGSASPNNAILPVSSSGELCVFASESTELIVDVVGVFSASGSLGYSAFSPRRTLDTRGSGSPAPGDKIVFNVLDDGSSGAHPVAAAVNLTTTNHQAAGFMTSYNCGLIPEVSALNQRAGVDVANGAHVPVVVDGTSCLHADTTGDFIVDVLGFWLFSK